MNFKQNLVPKTTSIQIMDLASLTENCMFYFYNDVTHFVDDPHLFTVAYEDDLAVTDEIYCRLSFNNPGIR